MSEEKKKNFFEDIADGIAKGFKVSAEAIADGTSLMAEEMTKGIKTSAEAIVDGTSVVADGIAKGFKNSADAIVYGTTYVTDLISDGTMAVLEQVDKTSELVVDQVSGGIGTIRDGVYYIGDKAVEGTVVVKDGVLSVGENIIGSIINTSKFIGDSEYREKEGIPWLKEIISSNKKVLSYQMQQNQKAMDVLYRYSTGENLSNDEKEVATKQLLDMIKLVPALAIFLLPGGMVLLPLLAKLLPWEVIPDLKPPEEGETKEGEAKESDAKPEEVDLKEAAAKA